MWGQAGASITGPSNLLELYVDRKHNYCNFISHLNVAYQTVSPSYLGNEAELIPSLQPLTYRRHDV